MNIKVSNYIELKISELPDELLQNITGDLTISNPAYYAALKQGRSIRHINEKIKLYWGSRDKLTLPRGYGPRLMAHVKNAGINYNFEDRRLTLPPVTFNSSIQLRDYQAPAVEKLVKYRQGGVVAGCGSGKTVILLEAMKRIGQPSLWVTHTQELADQVTERAIEMLGLDEDEIGLIGSGKKQLGDRLTVALIQTLSRMDLEEIKDRFGAVFVDEAHHLAARSFFYPISKFPALYRLWASATPERSDGLTQMVFAAGGPVLHTIDQCQVPTVIPRLEVIETDYDTRGDYVEVISDLINNEQRNNLVCKKIAAEAPGNYSLVLSDRKEHLKTLQQKLQTLLPEFTIEVITGDMGKRAREELMNRVQNRRVDILLATQLAREGLDIEHLNRLFLATPKRAAGAVQQEVGRIMRPCEGKKDPLVVDFWDSSCPILRGQFWARREVYKKLGMSWQPNKRRVTGSAV